MPSKVNFTWHYYEKVLINLLNLDNVYVILVLYLMLLVYGGEMSKKCFPRKVFLN